MADFQDDIARKARDKFEALLDRVPGLAAYRGLEKLRDQDKLIREHAVAVFSRIKAILDRGKADLLAGGGLALLGGLERLTSRLDAIMNAHRFAAYGYTGAFDANRIEEKELEKLREYDLGIVTKAEALRAALESAGPFDAASLPARLEDVQKAVAELESLVAGRRDLFQKNFA